MTQDTSVNERTRGAGHAFPRRAIAFAAAAFVATGCAVSQQSEVQMGREYAAQVEQQLPLIRDPEVVRYINVLGDSLARVTDDRSLTWHFSVVDAEEFKRRYPGLPLP